MSTQSIAVESMVVTELQNLYAAECALEQDYNQLRHAPDAEYHAQALFDRLVDLAAHANRLERMLEELDDVDLETDFYPAKAAIC